MKYIKSIIVLAVVFISATAFVNYNPSPEPAHNHDLKWHTNFDEASALSREEGKPIFAFFTGSDWCGWCIRLQKNVFAKEAFIHWAQDEVILLELDFPKRTPISDDLKQQNYALAQALGVRGYPTVWLLNTVYNKETKQYDLNRLGSAQYPRAEAGKEAEVFVTGLNKILNNK